MVSCKGESELYALWGARASTGVRLRDRDGRRIVVISRGERNLGAGPDFLDAVLLVDGHLVVGAVEMHRHERDWLAHGHHRDSAYEHVVLHVVERSSEPPLLAIATIMSEELRTLAKQPGQDGIDRVEGDGRRDRRRSCNRDDKSNRGAGNHDGESNRGAGNHEGESNPGAGNRDGESNRGAGNRDGASNPRVGDRDRQRNPGAGNVAPRHRDRAGRARGSDGVQHAAITRDLLVDCAWSRLLRRTTELLRARASGDHEYLRRAYLRRVFDALGYSANRLQMRRVVDEYLEVTAAQSPVTFDAVASMLFAVAGCDVAAVRAHGARFMSETRLDAIVEAASTAARERNHHAELPQWIRATRPANLPERRLWAAARIIIGVERHQQLERMLDRIAAGAQWHQIQGDLVVRLGAEAFLGRERASVILMNALLPVGLAAVILARSTPLIERICYLYRTAPSEPSNRVIRRFEARLLDGRVLRSGFWQQGAIELQQRYLGADRSMLSFVADSLDERYHSVSHAA